MKLDFCIATLTHPDTNRDKFLELTINSFLENTNISGINWYIYINGVSTEIFSKCNELQIKWKDRINLITIQSNTNLGVGAGINRLNNLIRDYKYTLFLEGDWITLPKDISGIDTYWVERSIDCMKLLDLDQIQLRKFQNDTDNRQFGLAYWTNPKNVIGYIGDYVLLNEREYTNNPHIRKNSTYYNLGILPLKEFYDERGNPTELKTSTHWGQAEIHAENKGKELKSAWLKGGNMVHCDHWHYNMDWEKVKTDITGCGYKTNSVINCKYGFTFPKEQFCKQCDDTKDFTDLEEHNWRFEKQLDKEYNESQLN